jgi:hypothetical protein
MEGLHISARAPHAINWIWFGYIARLFQWGGGGGILLVQMISTGLRCAQRQGGGSAPCGLYCAAGQRQRGGLEFGPFRDLRSQ